MIDHTHPVEQSLRTGLKRLLMWAVGLIFRSPAPEGSLFEYTLIHLTACQVATLA